MQLLLGVCLLFLIEATPSGEKQLDAVQTKQTEAIALGGWDQDVVDLTAIDTTIIPDYTIEYADYAGVQTNAAEPPEQLVKVTDRRHKFPVFATICSISFLVAFITLLIVCTS